MKVTFLVIGKTEESYLREGIKNYLDRLRHYLPFEYKELPASKGKQVSGIEALKKKEAGVVMDLLKPGDFLVLLDERGKEYRSVDFARQIQKHMNSGLKHLIFLVGGPYGFSEELYQKAQDRISLSQMTFSHQMVRLFFVEQFYRAMSILRNEPYHHE